MLEIKEDEVRYQLDRKNAWSY